MSNFIWLHSLPGRVSLQSFQSSDIPGEVQSQSYSQDALTDFINPDRGWMHRLTRDAFSTVRNGDSLVPQGYSVIWAATGGTPWSGSSGNPFRLDNYRNTSTLPVSLRNGVAAYLSDARSAGIKLKIRFAYNYSDGGTTGLPGSNGIDANNTITMGHIDQLAPILNDNRDVISSMDAGFIGRWGEWNYVSGTTWWEEPYTSRYRTIYQKLVDTLHPDIMIGFRYPRVDNGFRLFFNGGGGRADWSSYDTLENRFTDDNPITRSGLYMDCAWTNQSHGDTFNFDGGVQATDLEAANKISRISAVSGETCSLGGVGNPTSDGQNVLNPSFFASLPQLGVDTLYRHFWTDMYNKWISSGHYAEISRRLGYRLHMTQARTMTQANRGALLPLEIDMTNTGVGKVFNRRALEVILRPQGGGSDVPITIHQDCRRLLPLAGASTTVVADVPIPAGLSVGNYNLFLHMPDGHNGLRSDSRYDLRLANLGGLWSGSTGYHNLGLTVEVL